MADSDFWRDLASQFLSIPDASLLRADRDYKLGSETGNWRLSGNTRSIAHFDSLARRGAFELTSEENSDLLTAWLEALMAHPGSGYRQGVYYKEVTADGTDGPNHMTGSINHPHEGSANFCKALESEALQTEFEEKQRNDPKIAMAEPVPAQSTPDKTAEEQISLARPIPSTRETVATQLSRLRDESPLTVEQLAEAVDIDPRSVYRHLSGATLPHKRHLKAYEKVFSQVLQRTVVICKMSGKCQ